MGPDVVVPISAIEHHAYCPRQCGLIHVEGQWADNGATVEGTVAHRRADSGAHRRERGRLVLRSIPLWSEVLGLTGRADVIEVHDDGSVVPVEYKSGVRHGDAADLQLCAQALCLEEMLGVAVRHGFIWFRGPRKREAVAIDDPLRERTRLIVEVIRASIETGIVAPAVDDERCPSCQLRDACLPEVTAGSDSVERYVDRWVLPCAT